MIYYQQLAMFVLLFCVVAVLLWIVLMYVSKLFTEKQIGGKADHYDEWIKDIDPSFSEQETTRIVKK